MSSNKWNITKEFIMQEYFNNKKSILRIAKEIGIPYPALYRYKKEFGITSYPPSFWMKGKRISPKTEFKKGQVPWIQGKSLSEEQRKKISLSVKKAMEKESVKNKIQRTQFKKGMVPWNKGKNSGTVIRNKGINGFRGGWPKGKKRSDEDRNKISIATKKAMHRADIQEKIKLTQFQKGIIPWNKNKTNVFSEETINHIREARLRQIFPKKSTNAEIILFNILDELSIGFGRHKPVKNICQADAFIEPNIVLFADGDYWHCNPKFYSKPKTEAQFKNIKRDFRENDKLIKEGYIVVRFWEFDLINNKNKCKETIKKLIKYA